MTEHELINENIAMALSYQEKFDYREALKYASLASVATVYPRADVCCIMGDLYLNLGNLEWSIFWFEKAIGNIYLGVNGETIEESSYTWFPMLNLSYIYYKKGEIEKAKEYNDSVLKIMPDNENALTNDSVFKKIECNN